MKYKYVRGVKARPVPVAEGQKHTFPMVWVEFEKIPTRHLVINPMEARKIGQQLLAAATEAETVVRPAKNERRGKSASK